MPVVKYFESVCSRPTFRDNAGNAATLGEHRFSGCSLANIVNLFNPQRLILGGLTGAGEWLFELLRRARSPLLDDVEIVPAQLGAQVGISAAAHTG